MSEPERERSRGFVIEEKHTIAWKRGEISGDGLEHKAF